MKTVIVNQNDAEQRLDKFLSKLLNMPQNMLYKAIRKKRVKLNGKRAEISCRLKEGDKLDLYINDEFFKTEKSENLSNAPSDINIVYEDENILIADKPGGMPCHSSAGTQDADTLIGRVKAYLFKTGVYNPELENSFSPALCNRLDRNTSGLVIAAKNAAALRIINEKIKNREIEKYYVCLVVGVPNPPSGRIETYLKKDGGSNTVRVLEHSEKGAKRAVTEYSVIRESGAGAEVEIRLITGRTHQIRVHMAHIGHPIRGDVKYGAPKDSGRGYQQLRAYKIKFNFKEPCALDYLNGKTIEI